MIKSALLFGLLAGVLIAIFMRLTFPIWTTGDGFSYGNVLHVITFILGLMIAFWWLRRSTKPAFDATVAITVPHDFGFGVAISIVTTLVFVFAWIFLMRVTMPAAAAPSMLGALQPHSYFSTNPPSQFYIDSCLDIFFEGIFITFMFSMFLHPRIGILHAVNGAISQGKLNRAEQV